MSARRSTRPKLVLLFLAVAFLFPAAASACYVNEIIARKKSGLWLSLFAFVSLLAPHAMADRTLELVQASCQNKTTGEGIHASCRWGDGVCFLGASRWTVFGRCSSPDCFAYTSSSTGCMTTECCLERVTVNNACTEFTSPVYSKVTHYIKPEPPPPDPCFVEPCGD